MVNRPLWTLGWLSVHLDLAACPFFLASLCATDEATQGALVLHWCARREFKLDVASGTFAFVSAVEVTVDLSCCTSRTGGREVWSNFTSLVGTRERFGIIKQVDEVSMRDVENRGLQRNSLSWLILVGYSDSPDVFWFVPSVLPQTLKFADGHPFTRRKRGQVKGKCARTEM
jgi:hypothetical protein